MGTSPPIQMAQIFKAFSLIKILIQLVPTYTLVGISVVPVLDYPASVNHILPSLIVLSSLSSPHRVN